MSDYALLDIGGTTTRMAFAAKSQTRKMRGRLTAPTPYRYSTFLRLIKDMLRRQKTQPLAVGVSFGVGLKDGRVIAASKMPDFVGRPIAQDLSKVFDAPAFVHHDCVCAVASQASQLRDGESFAYVTVSTGLGAAVVTRSNNRLFFERIRLAHHVIDLQSTDKCACGRLGCMATFVDSSRWKSKGVDLARRSDQVFRQLYIHSLSVGLANLCRMFGLSQLFIGGGVTRNRWLRRAIIPATESQLPEDGYQKTRVALLPDEATAPLRGACLLIGADDHLFKES